MLGGLAGVGGLGWVPLLVTQAHGNPAQGDTSALMADPDLSTTHPTCGGMSSFEPLHYRDPFAIFLFQGQIVRREAHHQVRQLPLDKGDACTQAIAPIRADNVPPLQLNALQMLAY